MNKELLQNTGMKYRSDKFTYHGYHRFYHKYLPQDLQSKIDILEIGVLNLSSVYTWLELYPHSHITGFDIDTIDRDIPRTHFVQGDQSNVESLKQLSTKQYDVIIDDGSHIPSHQLLSFNYLFEYVKSGGTYIIENIETSYWKRGSLYGYDLGNDINIVDSFKKILDNVNHTFIETQDQQVNNIESVVFAYNCVIITKKHSNDSNFDKSFDEYMYKHCIA